MKPYTDEMREYLLPMLREGQTRKEGALPSCNTLPRLTAKQRQQVESLSTERGYRPFQAWHLGR